ncbi:hypothetical protein DNTS_011021, partial [Danionella cerebrum]
LFPAVLNLASMAGIETNATCGESGPEMYCKLVEHVPGRPVKNPQCRTCNLQSDQDYGNACTFAHCTTVNSPNTVLLPEV